MVSVFSLVAKGATKLRDEVRFLLAALRLPSLAVLLLVLLCSLVIVVQIPLSYTIDVGREEGYGGDLPLLWHFNTAEDDEHGTYRWTQDGAAVVLPGMGQRPLVVHLTFVPISPLAQQHGPDHMTVMLHTSHLATLPVFAEGRSYHMLVPPAEMSRGVLSLVFRTATFTPPDDPRHLGSPLDSVRVTSVVPASLAGPAWGTVALWTGAIVVYWLVVMRCLCTERTRVLWAQWFVGGSVSLVVLAALLDPPRWGYGAQPALVAAALSYLLAVVLWYALPPLAARLHIPLTPRTLGWLLLITAVAFGLRFGGRLFPLSMWGDLGFHTNRFIDTFGLGQVYLLSRNRGVNFPYPPGPYLTLAPLVLTFLDIRLVLQLVASLADALSAPLVYTITVGALAQQGKTAGKTGETRTATASDKHVALLAAATYVLTAAGFMLSWWSFDTHIYTQFAALVLVTALVLVGGQPRPTLARLRWQTPLVGVLFCGVFLGHFGFLINVVLLGGMVLLVVWGAAWRGSEVARVFRWPLALAYVGAGMCAALLFYSDYVWLFRDQVYAVTHGGLTGLAERAPVGRDRLWRVLWEAGIIQHYGFFPLLLVPVGVWHLATRGTEADRTRRMVVLLMVCSIIVSVTFAVLPFITLSTQSTRWLTFSAWVVAVAAAVAVRLLWRGGYAGRVVVVTMAGFVAWNTITFWIGPMLWRIRPPEPF